MHDHRDSLLRPGSSLFSHPASCWLHKKKPEGSPEAGDSPCTLGVPFSTQLQGCVLQPVGPNVLILCEGRVWVPRFSVCLPFSRLLILLLDLIRMC